MANAELIAALKDAEGYIRYVAPSCIASDEAKEAIRDAADALEAADKRIEELSLDCEMFQQKCMELGAQIPKKGEWIEVHDWLQIPQEERGTYRCSACGQVMKYPRSLLPELRREDGGRKERR